MYNFVTPLLVASLIAISATEPAKKLAKRGLIGGNNDFDALGVDSSAKYLPPVSSVTSVKRPYVVSSVPSSSYSVPSYSEQSYGVPAPALVPSYSAPAPVPAPVAFSVPAPAPVSVPVAAPAPVALPVPPPAPLAVPVPSPAPVPVSFPTYSAPVAAPVPSYSAPISVPAPTYGVPVSAPLPAFSASAPVSVPSSSYGFPSLSSVHSASIQTASVPLSTGPVSVPSTSYGVPSTVVQSVPSVGVSFNSASYPSQTSSHHVPAGRLSLSSLSVPVRSNGVSSYSSGFASGSVSSSLSAASANDGYSYPVPSKRLFV
ncbi:SH3 domain-containing protein C23A1.17-like [Frieseomelitta varia]|uniref:SH3 domain-containing protein C23A1.17-like n=1 Tax=Frieseomelitta varia TaxID=561572 RepID=UPI001CB6B5CF|nr:SH3 domain-containing protein C23A1.17-like [Frieseomelitta varia]